MKCDYALELMSSYLDKELNTNDEHLFLEHLEECPQCKVLFNEMKHIVTTLNTLPVIDLPENYHNELMEKINTFKVHNISPTVKQNKFIHWKKYSTIAAAFLLLIVVGSNPEIYSNNPKNIKDSTYIKNAQSEASNSLIAPQNIGSTKLESEGSDTNSDSAIAQSRSPKSQPLELTDNQTTTNELNISAPQNTPSSNGTSQATTGAGIEKNTSSNTTTATQTNPEPVASSAATKIGTDTPAVAGHSLLTGETVEKSTDKIIKEADIIMEVSEIGYSMSLLNEKLSNLGGYIKTYNGNDYNPKEVTTPILEECSLTVIIQSSNYETSKEIISALGTVIDTKEKSQDITDKYVIVENNLSEKQKESEFLKNNQSETIDNSQKINSLNSDIEIYKNTINEMDSKVNSSTLNVTLKKSN